MENWNTREGGGGIESGRQWRNDHYLGPSNVRYWLPQCQPRDDIRHTRLEVQYKMGNRGTTQHTGVVCKLRHTRIKEKEVVGKGHGN